MSDGPRVPDAMGNGRDRIITPDNKPDRLTVTPLDKLRNKLTFALRGLRARWLIREQRRCPGCSSSVLTTRDTKFPYKLLECQNCHLLFRYPETAGDDETEFYQEDYVQPGFTTQLPTDQQLRVMLDTNFTKMGQGKSFARIIDLLHAVGIVKGNSVLDYGANWGYGAYQLRKAGFVADAYEISKPRARFGEKLGVDVKTTVSDLSPPYHAVYSGHVLEHVPNPAKTIREQLDLIAPGGFVLAHTPNGSRDAQATDYRTFHSRWGRLHPVLLSDLFIESNFPDLAKVIASDDNLTFHRSTASLLADWDQSTFISGDKSKDELLFILKKPA